MAIVLVTVAFRYWRLRGKRPPSEAGKTGVAIYGLATGLGGALMLVRSAS